MKKIIAILLCVLLTIATLSSFTGATDISISLDLSAELLEAYNNVKAYAEQNGIVFGMTFETFVSEYPGGNVSDYEQEFYRLLRAETNDIQSSGGDEKHTYYYDTGTDWYCSELVWAGYMAAGIDIEVANKGAPGITPHDILNSELTYRIVYHKLPGES